MEVQLLPKSLSTKTSSQFRQYKNNTMVWEYYLLRHFIAMEAKDCGVVLKTNGSFYAQAQGSSSETHNT